jgi:hypothetical protein
MRNQVVVEISCANALDWISRVAALASDPF